MFDLSSDWLEKYHQDGYIVIDDNLIAKDARKELFSTLCSVFNKYNTNDPLQYQKLSWEDQHFHNRLLEFRLKAPKLFGAMYDTVQECLALHIMLHNSVLLEIVSQILKQSAFGLTTTGAMLRMDPPFDGRNKLTWHQESAYYIQNLEGHHGVVIWTPLLDTSPELGPINICPGSHKLGKLHLESDRHQDQSYSEQFAVNPEIINQSPAVAPEVRAGSCVFFNMNTVHSSGNNSSSKIRFAAGIRYHNMLTNDFLPGRLTFVPNTSVGRFQE